jgi:hypothetical protein
VYRLGHRSFTRPRVLPAERRFDLGEQCRHGGGGEFGGELVTDGGLVVGHAVTRWTARRVQVGVLALVERLSVVTHGLFQQGHAVTHPLVCGEFSERSSLATFSTVASSRVATLLVKIAAEDISRR